jgi:hypothetical protein
VKLSLDAISEIDTVVRDSQPDLKEVVLRIVGYVVQILH